MGLLSGSNAAFKSVDRTNFYATAGQTTFTLSQGYSVGDIDVYLNGIRLVDADDYFATNGSTVVLASGAALNDHLLVVSYNQFSAANTYSKSESDGRYMVATGQTPMTSYLRTPNYGVSSWSDSAAASLEASVGSGTQGVGIKAWGRSMSSWGGDIHYIADTRGVSGSHRFYGWNGTAWTENLKIDPSGRVTKPNQVCFNAYRAASWTTTDQQVLVWDSTHINRGAAYNTSNGRFTAPVAGAYYFMGYQLTQNTASTGDVRFRINGSIVAGNYGYGSNTTNHKQMRISGLYQMNANDYIEVISWGSQSWNDNHGGFSGFLVG